MKKFHLLSYALLVGASTLLLFLLGTLYIAYTASRPYSVQTKVVSQVHALQAAAALPGLHQVVAGPAVEVPGLPSVRGRYKFVNKFPEDVNVRAYLIITDTQTSETTRLGDNTGDASARSWGDQSLFWDFSCIQQCTTYQTGSYVYIFASKENIFVSSKSSIIHPKHGDDWVAHAMQNSLSSFNSTYDSTLYATNLRTHETLTLTTHAPLDAVLDSFAISSRLVVWNAYPPATAPQEERLAIYDLSTRSLITEVNPALPMGNHTSPISELGAGETVVTWEKYYGYDLVTGSYFTITLAPPNWTPQPIGDINPVTESERVLHWSFEMKDNTKRYFQAPLIDASPSVTPCIEGQNLVQNGDLENVVTHNAWQQSGNPSPLIVNALPPNSAQAGQWAIRLGRYSNAQPTIQQTLNIPSGVKHITLAFDVRASSWDIWGGDQLQVDLIDPVTHQSILATPVQWTNRQLASGGWIPLQVDIQDWPGIDTPLQLVFRAQTDWAFPTDFTLDNIRFITSCR